MSVYLAEAAADVDAGAAEPAFDEAGADDEAGAAVGL